MVVGLEEQLTVEVIRPAYGKWVLQRDYGGVVRPTWKTGSGLRWEKLRGKGSENLHNIERIWRRVQSKQGQLLKEPLRCDGDLCAATGKIFKSQHFSHKDVKDENGSYTEYMCYDCWAFEQCSPVPPHLPSLEFWCPLLIDGCSDGRDHCGLKEKQQY